MANRKARPALAPRGKPTPVFDSFRASDANPGSVLAAIGLGTLGGWVYGFRCVVRVGEAVVCVPSRRARPCLKRQRDGLNSNLAAPARLDLLEAFTEANRPLFWGGGGASICCLLCSLLVVTQRDTTR